MYKFPLNPEEGGEGGFINEGDDLDLRDDAQIFTDNLYLVEMEGQSDQFPVEVETVYVGDSDLWLRPIERLRPGSTLDTALSDENGILWLHDLLNPVPFERRHDALDSVQKRPNERQLLTGNRQLHFEADRYSVPDPPLQLNDSQEQALIWAKAAEDCLCIHEPPGTGKTRTLTAFIRTAVAQRDRVLVTAHSNQAVDNLLVGDSTVEEPEPDTLHAMAQSEDSDFSIARAGSNSENAAVTQYYDSVSTQAADVVAATTSGAAQFKSSSFDVAVVDEATQASRAATTIAMSVSQKLVLAGDHKQLPSYSASDDILGDDQRLSLFETLLDRYDNDIAVMLKTQYRMNDEIVAFPNAEFYGGDLSTVEQNRDWTVDDLSPLMGIDIHGPEREQTAGHSYYNEAEAEAAAKQVKLLTNSGLAPSDIGIIAAYSAQVDEIRQRVRRLDIAGVHRVAVFTVDSFQGSECEAVIVSLTRSNDHAASGFLTIPDEGPRRLNVALTRGRKRLVIIADWDTLGEPASFRDRNETCADLYARLTSHIR